MDKQEYQEYLKSSHWQEIKQKVYKYREGKCQQWFCDETRKLNVHHRHYNSLGHESYRKDLMLLCQKHHYRKHIKKWILSLRPSSFFNWFVEMYADL